MSPIVQSSDCTQVGFGIIYNYDHYHLPGGVTIEIVRIGDFEKFVCISIYFVSALSLHIESTDSMIRDLGATLLEFKLQLLVDKTHKHIPTVHHTP